MMWGMHMGYGGWGFLLTIVLWIGLIALGIWLLARLFPRAADGNHSRYSPGASYREAPSAETPLQILQKRYARGEITKEEYETIRQDLAS